MSRPTQLVVMFADICGSSKLYKNLGDILASKIITHCLALLTEEVNAHSGIVIKTIGDEIMTVFPSVKQAYLATSAMQKKLKFYRFINDTRLFIHIGFHFGDVVYEENDVFGETVNIAAHLTSLAKAEKILVSKTCVQALPVDLQSAAQFLMQLPIKSMPEGLDIYMLEWCEDEERTRFSSIQRNTSQEFCQLNLTYASQDYTVDQVSRILTVGRSESCNLVVNSKFASRQHARFEMRTDKFYFIDQSTNGSYVSSEWGHITHICHQEIILQFSGKIILGQQFSEDTSQWIAFKLS